MHQLMSDDDRARAEAVLDDAWANVEAMKDGYLDAYDHSTVAKIAFATALVRMAAEIWIGLGGVGLARKQLELAIGHLKRVKHGARPPARGVH